MNDRHRVRAIAAAVLMTAVVGIARAAIAPAVLERIPLLPFLSCVLIAAWLGGFWPGMLATALGGVAGTYFFILRAGSLLPRPTDWFGIVLFLATGIAISAAFEALIRARNRAERAQHAMRESSAGLATEADALTRLSEASSRLWGISTLNEGLDETLGASITLLGADMGNLQVLDPERRVLRIAVQRGFQSDFLDYFREVSAADDSACGRALRSGERIVIEDVESDAQFTPHRAIARASGFRAVQSTPLISRSGTPLGMLSTHWRAVHTPAKQDLRMLDLYARQAAEFIERWRVDSALRESEERFRHMADSAPVLIWISGTDKRCTWVNQRWLEFVGRPMEQEVGNGWADNVHREDLNRCLETYSTAFDARQPFTMEYRLRRHDGEYRWLLCSGIPLFDMGGDFTGYIGSCKDITVRKQAEAALKQLNEALKLADRRKDEFLAVLAHELRNPLAPIRTAAHLLRMKELSDPDLKRPVEMIERQAAHMARLVDDLLDVSRVATGMLQLRVQLVDFQEVIRAVLDVCRDDIDSRGHTLHVSLPGTPVRLEADRDRLIQVFCNVLSNAAKYTPPHGTIHLDARVNDKVLEVAVKDNGRGIPREKLKDVFELFARVDRSVDAQDGLGIGISLARQLLALHGGTIEARSEGLNQGSTFLVRLPIPARAARAEVPSPKAVTEPRRVLLVDDNEDAAESLALVLGMSGHITRVALDGEAALRIASEFRPEVAFLDIGMPHMDGYELAGRLRDSAWGKSIFLVALTGWGQESDQQRAREAGFDTHLVKPAAPDVVARLLAGVGSNRATPAAARG